MNDFDDVGWCLIWIAGVELAGQIVYGLIG